MQATVSKLVALAIAATYVIAAFALEKSWPFAMTVACFGMGLSLEEALAAATVNAACSLDLQDEVGRLEVGKRADLVILRSARLLELLRVGVPAIRTVIKDGRVVVAEGRRVRD